MDQRKQREIARKGGQAAHQKGTAHEFTSDEARAAGRKGGEIVSANRAHMSAIGRKGGESSHSGQRAPRDTAMPDAPVNNDIIEERADALDNNGGTAGNEHEMSDEGNAGSHETNRHGEDRSAENGAVEASPANRHDADWNRE